MLPRSPRILAARPLFAGGAPPRPRHRRPTPACVGLVCIRDAPLSLTPDTHLSPDTSLDLGKLLAHLMPLFQIHAVRLELQDPVDVGNRVFRPARVGQQPRTDREIRTESGLRSILLSNCRSSDSASLGTNRCFRTGQKSM